MMALFYMFKAGTLTIDLLFSLYDYHKTYGYYL
jgi:hypothetical protein